MSQSGGNIAVTLGLALVLSTLVGGTAAWFVTRGATSERQRRESRSPSSELAERVDALEARVDQLARELSGLRQQRAAERRLVQFADSLRRGEGADGTDEDAAQASALSRGDDPQFELAVRQVLDRIDWEREEEQKLVSAQRQEQRAQRQSHLIAERLELAPHQREQLAQVLARQMQAFRALRDPPTGEERPATRSEWAERMQGIRADTEAALAQFLSEQQLEQYRKFSEEEGFGPGLRRQRAAAAPSAEPASGAGEGN